MSKPRAPYLAAFFLLFSGLSAAETPLWTEWLSARASGASGLLPDFSYAGYRHGEAPIPDVKGPVFKAEDYGAVVNDDKPDFEAIQKAIEACEAAGGGVVLLGKGSYLINATEEDAVKPRLRISKSGVVLRGAGCGPGGTVLAMPAQMQPVKPEEMWSGRCPLVVQPEGSGYGGRKAKVAAPAPLNGLSLTLEAGQPFKVGDRFMLRVVRKGQDAAPYVAPHPWEDAWTSGSYIREYHEVAAVDGATVRLGEPLMIAVDAGSDWYVQEVRLISNVGVEDLCFKGAWKEDFKHHRSWRDDSAWRGIWMTGLENGWLRRCVFEDMNWPVHVTSSRQITVEEVDLTGTPGHFGMQVTGTYGVLGLAVRDSAGHHHGPSLQSGSCATVYHRCTWSGRKSFDSHANNPYATLHDRNQGGLDLSGVGGAKNNFPHHLHALVLWNLEVTDPTRREVNFWTVGNMSYPVAFAHVLIAGLHGEGFSGLRFDEESIARNESPGAAVTPDSLWLAQLEKRLGKLPPHFAARAR